MTGTRTACVTYDIYIPGCESGVGLGAGVGDGVGSTGATGGEYDGAVPGVVLPDDCVGVAATVGDGVTVEAVVGVTVTLGTRVSELKDDMARTGSLVPSEYVI